MLQLRSLVLRWLVPLAVQWSAILPLVLGDSANSNFSVFWNAPSESCEKHGIHLDLDRYEIKHNYHLKFKGTVITLFYADHTNFGAFPYIDSKGKEVNGGIPQKANMMHHLAMIKTNIEASLDANFAGLAVIDWETWRPIFDRNWGQMRIYQRKSLDFVKARFPKLSPKSAWAKAKAEWNFSAEKLLLASLNLATQLRPRARWGFYKFPECYNYKAEHPWCGPTVERLDDELMWMWNASSALFPSAYFGEKWPKTFEAKKNLVRGHVEEAFRVGQKQQLPVYFYMKYSYSSTSFASKEDLEAALQLTADLGAAGTILWDSSSPFRDRGYCSRLRSDLHSLLGPFALRVIEEAGACAAARCHGHGRCALKDARALLGAAVIPSRVARRDKDFRCRCFEGWKGESCQEREKVSKQ